MVNGLGVIIINNVYIVNNVDAAIVLYLLLSPSIFCYLLPLSLYENISIVLYLLYLPLSSAISFHYCRQRINQLVYSSTCLLINQLVYLSTRQLVYSFTCLLVN